jgi:hypothetical protein
VLIVIMSFRYQFRKLFGTPLSFRSLKRNPAMCERIILANDGQHLNYSERIRTIPGYRDNKRILSDIDTLRKFVVSITSEKHAESGGCSNRIVGRPPLRNS